MKRLTILFALLLIGCSPCVVAQDVTLPPPLPAPSAELVASSPFRTAVIKGIRAKIQKGEMTRRDGLKLRVALLSPAFCEHAETLAVTQMFFASPDDLSFNDAGFVERASIDWENLMSFIERLIPILLQLLEIFG